MQYTIIGGVNGVGKSSLFGVLTNTVSDLGIYINPDKIAKSTNGDEYIAGQKAIHLIDECLEQCINFTQESTLSGGYVRKTAKRAKEKGYHVRLFFVALDSAEDSLERIQNRVKRGGHNIPEQDVRRRFEKRFVDLWKVLPLCDEAELYDNSNGFRKVAEYANGEICPLPDSSMEIPKWLKELLVFKKSII